VILLAVVLVKVNALDPLLYVKRRLRSDPLPIFRAGLTLNQDMVTVPLVLAVVAGVELKIPKVG